MKFNNFLILCAGFWLVKLGECCDDVAAMCDSSNRQIIIHDEVVTLTTQIPLDTDCIFEIRRKPEYCSVKLDFVQFSSQSADQNGTCITDSLSIRGSSTVPDGFETCGLLTGQHMYLAFGKTGSIEIIPSYSSQSHGAYQILATQIPCNRVPNHCLQYFDTSRGVVKSFDFPQRQQSSQEYTVCVGGVAHAASITWKPCSTENAGSDNSFSITSGNPFGDWNCRHERDWIQVNGQNQMCKRTDFPVAGVRSTFSPFLLNVHFNELEKQPLPCYDEILKLTEGSCINGGMGPATGNPCIDANYESCAWDGEASHQFCSCNPTSAVWDMLEGDVLNTGFCLEYTQNNRR